MINIENTNIYKILNKFDITAIELDSENTDEIKTRYKVKYIISLRELLDDIFGDGRDNNGMISLPKRHTTLIYFSILKCFFNPYLNNWNIDDAKNNTTIRGNVAGFINGRNDTRIFSYIEKIFLDNSDKMIASIESKIDEAITSEEITINGEKIPFIFNDEKSTREYLLFICRNFINYISLLKDETLTSAITFDEKQFSKKSTARLLAECLLFFAVSLRSNESGKPGKFSKSSKSSLSPEKIIKIWAPYADIPADDLMILKLNVATLFETANLKIAQKKYNDSFKLFSEILSSNEQEAFLYKNQSLSKQAWLIQTKKVDLPDYDIKTKLLNASEKNPHYETVAYSLSQMFPHDIDEKSDYMKWLKKAGELESIPAVIELVNIWENNTSVNCQSKKINDKKTDIYLLELLKKTNILYSQCREVYFLLGKYYELCADNTNSQKYYQYAADLGHDAARQKLDAKIRKIRIKNNRDFKSSASNVCVINGSEKINCYFVNSLSLEEPWHVFSLQAEATERFTPINDIEDLFSCKEGLNLLNNNKVLVDNLPSGKLLFAFLSDNQNKNIRECLELLDWLYNIVVTEPKIRHKLIEKVDIYINSEYESASMVLDASVSDMGNGIFFRTHIVNRAKNSIGNLLLTNPLFTTIIRRRQAEDSTIYDNTIQVVVLGNSELTDSAVTDILSCCYMGEDFNLKLSIISPEAEMAKKKFYRNCPGYEKTNVKNIIIPNYIHINDYEEISEKYFASLYNFEDETSLPYVLSNADYFVIDVGQDFDNIKFAKLIREYAIKRDDTFNHIPMIAAYCQDDSTAFSALKLTVGNRTPGEFFYNNYNIICFGMNDTVFSYRTLCDNRIEKEALYIHSVYYGDDAFAGQNSYYSFHYNRDSSRATAISLPYRMFAQGLYFSKWQQYSSEQYNDWSELLDNIEKMNIIKAAENEHYRWINYMLCHGWAKATVEQVESYLSQATGNDHKHLLAKLHPFISNWEDLRNDISGNMIDTVSKKFPDLKSPIDSTLENIKHTKEFISSVLK